ncbi:MAG: serine/threonine protein kinase [Deltaproteobacteria bacterium]|nr:serine/threonine protein kinase [Deltaproteobacteria bacterium]
MPAARGPERIGRYLLFDALASGGMATVHLGRLIGPVGFSRTVAIKRLHSYLAKQTEFASMFIDEARLAARIRHPNVVPILDVVALPSELFLVMEYVEGESLSKLLASTKVQNKGIAPKIAAAILVGVLHGLNAAHVATDERGFPLGMVHRDVSPQNILVGVDGLARMVDFGIAQASQRLQITGTGIVKGKVEYMSREQVCFERVDLRTDIYAASVVLWEALTGQRLFKGTDPRELKKQIIAGTPHPPSKLASAVSPELDAVVMRGLSTDASQRYPSAAEMAADLEKTGGIASQREVSEWVREIAAPVIAVRAGMVARVEAWSESSGTGSRSHKAPDLEETVDYKDSASEDLSSSAEAPVEEEESTEESAVTRATVDSSLVAIDNTLEGIEGAARKPGPEQTSAYGETGEVPSDAIEAPTLAATPIARQEELLAAAETLALEKKPPQRPKRSLVPATAAAVAAALLVLGLVGWWVSSAQGPAAVASAPSATEGAPSATLSAPSAGMSVAAPVQADAAPETPVPIATESAAPAKTSAPPAKTGVRVVKPPLPPSCDPPYTIDNLGVRIPKRHCFTK